MKRPLAPALIVDGSSATLASIARILERIGIRDVDRASDGADAISMLEARQYGLVISDWHIGTVNGLELLRHMRGNERLAPVPFIMTMGLVEVEAVLVARQAGADAVVLKPFGIQGLRAKIRDALHQKPKYGWPVPSRGDDTAGTPNPGHETQAA